MIHNNRKTTPSPEKKMPQYFYMQVKQIDILVNYAQTLTMLYFTKHLY